MTTLRTVRVRAGALVGMLSIALAAGLAPAPAGAVPSFPAAPGFGFAPNPSGGDGTPGSTSPYQPATSPTLQLEVPGTQTLPFGGSDDTTVDVAIVVPVEMTSPVCGAAKTRQNDASTQFTDQPGSVVAGWSCSVITANSHQVVHFTGPQVVAPQTVADSAQFFSLTVTVPSPAVTTTYDGTNGSEGFIVDQTYASGKIYHWIPSDDFIGVQPPTSTTIVAAGLGRSVSGPGNGYQPVAPLRLLDSRSPAIGGWPGKLTAGVPRSLSVVGGATGVPLDVEAVVMNVTVTQGDTGSFLTLYPAGQLGIPIASNLNFAANQSIPNLVTVKVGALGQVAFFNALGSVHVVADLVGYFGPAAPDRFNPLDPTRVLDTRTTIGGVNHQITAGAPLDFDARVGGVPATADSVLMNVTATNGTANSFLTVYPSGSPAVPNASNLNFGANGTIANLVSVKLGPDGHIAFANNAGSVDIVADMVGYFDPTSGDLFHGQSPNRILDSRTAVGGWSGKLVAGAPRQLVTRGTGGVRVDATAVVANATVTNGSVPSYLTVYPSGAVSVPNVSNLNFAAGETIPNLVAVKIGANGNLSFDNHLGSVDVVFDVVGYFAPT